MMPFHACSFALRCVVMDPFLITHESGQEMHFTPFCDVPNAQRKSQLSTLSD
jgi:hypothetical protein